MLFSKIESGSDIDFGNFQLNELTFFPTITKPKAHSEIRVGQCPSGILPCERIVQIWVQEKLSGIYGNILTEDINPFTVVTGWQNSSSISDCGSGTWKIWKAFPGIDSPIVASRCGTYFMSISKVSADKPEHLEFADTTRSCSCLGVARCHGLRCIGILFDFESENNPGRIQRTFVDKIQFRKRGVFWKYDWTETKGFIVVIPDDIPITILISERHPAYRWSPSTAT